MEAPTTHTVNVFNVAFSPSSLTIEVGDTVSWDNLGGFHTVTSYATPAGESFDSGNPMPDPYVRVFDTTGEYRYYCVNHATVTGGVCNGSMCAMLTVNPAGTSPSIAITSPVEGATVMGTLSVEGTAAHDSESIAKVEVRVDAGAFQLATLAGSGTSVTWTYSLNTAAVTNGGHALTARVTTSALRTAEDSVGITVNNPNTVDFHVTQISATSVGITSTPLTVKVRNDGNTASVTYTLRVEYKRNESSTWKLVSNGTREGIPAGVEMTYPVTWTSAGKLVGRFDVRALADPHGLVAEVSETNNERRGTASFVSTLVPGIDLNDTPPSG